MVAQAFFDSHTLVPVENEAGGQARTWRICSQGKVNVRSEPLHEAERIRYAEAGEEFEATGPFRIQRDKLKKPSTIEWLCMANGGGYVCTTSSKDPGKLVACLKRKRSSTQMKEPDVALLIKPEWCDQILDNGKVWEIRGERCLKRGRFAIAASGTGTLVGEATLVDSLPVGKYNAESKELEPYRNEKKYRRLFMAKEWNMPKHRIKDLSIVTYPKVYAWVLDDAVRYKKPVPYDHPQGCVKWVKLGDTGNGGVELMEEDNGGKSDASSSPSSSSESQSSGEEPDDPVKGSPRAAPEVESPEAKAAAAPEAKSPEKAAAALEATSPEAKSPEKVAAPPEEKSPEEKVAAAAAALQIPDAGTPALQRLQWATSMLNSGLSEDSVVALFQCLLEATGDLGPDPAKAIAALKESKAGFAVRKWESSGKPRVATLAKKVTERWWAQARGQRR